MKSRVSVAAAALAIFAAACSDGSSPVAPDQVLPGPADLAWLHYEGPGRDPEPGKVKICKFRDITSANLNPNIGVEGLFTTTATSGTVLFPELELDEEYCEYLWEGTENTRITITEDQTGPNKLTGLLYYGFRTDIQQWDFIPATTPTITIDVDVTRGTTILYNNRHEVTPEVIGGQGCVPGFWKKSRNYAFWTAPYTPTTRFSTVFNSTAFGTKTLWQVLAQGGNRENALGRHAVAALLNAASTGVNYDLTEAQVIAAFNTAMTTGTRTAILNQRNVFRQFNRQGCPLR